MRGALGGGTEDFEALVADARAAALIAHSRGGTQGDRWSAFRLTLLPRSRSFICGTCAMCCICSWREGMRSQHHAHH